MVCCFKQPPRICFLLQLLLQLQRLLEVGKLVLQHAAADAEFCCCCCELLLVLLLLPMWQQSRQPVLLLLLLLLLLQLGLCS